MLFTDLYEYYNRPTMLQNMIIVTQIRQNLLRDGILVYDNIFYCCCAISVFNLFSIRIPMIKVYIPNNIMAKPNLLYFLETMTNGKKENAHVGP